MKHAVVLFNFDDDAAHIQGIFDGSKADLDKVSKTQLGLGLELGLGLKSRRQL